MNLRHWAVFVIAGSAGGCSYGHKDVDPTSIPLNPHPTKTIHIAGILAKDFRVSRLTVVYSTNSNSGRCNGLDFPDGGPFPRQTKIVVTPAVSPGRVDASIQLDHFLPGKCHWQLEGIYPTVESQRGEKDKPLVAINYKWYKAHNLLGDQDQIGNTSTFYCGHKHGTFGCFDGAVGDASYYPVEIKDQTDHINFVIRASDAEHGPQKN